MYGDFGTEPEEERKPIEYAKDVIEPFVELFLDPETRGRFLEGTAGFFVPIYNGAHKAWLYLPKF